MQGSRRVALGLRHPRRAFTITLLVILVLDRVSKWLVRANIPEGASRDAIAGVMRLTHVRNDGAAFGLFPGRQSVFITVSVLVLFAIAAYWRWARPTEWQVVVPLGSIAGGAIGNLVDRALVGRVTDFFDFSQIRFSAVFNVADAAIVVGVGVLMLWILIAPVDPPVDAAESGGASAPVPVGPSGAPLDEAPGAEPDEAVAEAGTR